MPFFYLFFFKKNKTTGVVNVETFQIYISYLNKQRSSHEEICTF